MRARAADGTVGPVAEAAAVSAGVAKGDEASAGPASGGAATRGAAAAEVTPSLAFTAVGAGVVEHASVPMLRLDLRVDAGEARVRSLSLNAQVRIAAPARPYDPAERARLFELFGAERDWGRSLRSLLWAQTSLVVPAFEGSTAFELRVPCSYDFDVAAHKYLHAVREGVIPLELLFSGSVFYAGPSGALRTVRLPWDRECRFDMPAALWHELMDRYFPHSAWLRVRRDVFDRLHAYRSMQGLMSWEATLEALLPESVPSDPPPGGER